MPPFATPRALYASLLLHAAAREDPTLVGMMCAHMAVQVRAGADDACEAAARSSMAMQHFDLWSYVAGSWAVELLGEAPS